MKRDNDIDMSLTDLTTAICGEPIFRSLPIRDVYEIAKKAQKQAIARLKRNG